jgi:hypothetical protein
MYYNLFYSSSKMRLLNDIINIFHYLYKKQQSHSRRIYHLILQHIYRLKTWRFSARIDDMSSLIRRRDVFTKVRTTLKEFSLKNRKKHFINEINNLLRSKSIDEIDVSTSLFFLERVEILLSTLIVKKQISLTLKKINNKLNNIERNIVKIIITLI